VKKGGIHEEKVQFKKRSYGIESQGSQETKKIKPWLGGNYRPPGRIERRGEVALWIKTGWSLWESRERDSLCPENGCTVIFGES